jgi:hypothetical protein
VAVERIKSRLGRSKLQALTPLEIERFYASLAADGGRDGKPLSAKSVRNTHVVLRKALADAERLGVVNRNAADAERLGVVSRNAAGPTADGPHRRAPDLEPGRPPRLLRPGAGRPLLRRLRPVRHHRHAPG